MINLSDLKAKSKKVLQSGLNPIVKDAAAKLIEAAYKRGIAILLTQGFRTKEYQQKLYNQGRTTPGKIVTNCKPGYSPHNYGLAVDFVILTPDGKKALWNTKVDQDKDKKADWMEVVEEAKKLGFAWGGDFKSFKDNPHFEMMFGLSIADLRAGKKPPTSVKPKPKPYKTKYPLPDGILTEGSEGKKVVMLQKAVKALGFDCGAVDGNFGPKVKAAVKKYQTSRGIEADGKFGPKTKKSMEYVLKEKGL